MQQIEAITFRNIEIRARVVHTWVVRHDFFSLFYQKNSVQLVNFILYLNFIHL